MSSLQPADYMHPKIAIRVTLHICTSQLYVTLSKTWNLAPRLGRYLSGTLNHSATSLLLKTSRYQLMPVKISIFRRSK